jgi:hypothetical protein
VGEKQDLWVSISRNNFSQSYGKQKHAYKIRAPNVEKTFSTKIFTLFLPCAPEMNTKQTESRSWIINAHRKMRLKHANKFQRTTHKKKKKKIN